MGIFTRKRLLLLGWGLSLLASPGCGDESGHGTSGEEGEGADAGDLDRAPEVVQGGVSWHAFFGSATGDDTAHAVIVDEEGGLYLAGCATSSWIGPGGQRPLHAHAGDRDLFLLKLDLDGTYQWHTFLGSAGDDCGGEFSLGLYGVELVYVSAFAPLSWEGPQGQVSLNAHPGAADQETWVAMALSPEGELVWHTFYPGAASALGVDASGNVYVVGTVVGVSEGTGVTRPTRYEQDGFVMSLDSSGALRWQSSFGAEDDVDYGVSLGIGVSGDLFLTGISAHPWEGPQGQPPLVSHRAGETIRDLFVMALTSTGGYHWHTFIGTGDVSSIGVDGNENLYLTGTTLDWLGPEGQPPLRSYSGVASEEEVYLLKLDSAGLYQWHTFYGSGDFDWGEAVVVASDGNLFVLGCSVETWQGTAGQDPLHEHSGGYDDDLFILELNPNGDYKRHTFFGSGEGRDSGEALTIAGQGDLFVTGYSESSWLGQDGQSPLFPYSGALDAFVLHLSL